MKINLTAETEKFIKSLDRDTIAKTLRTIELLERFGHNLELPHSKSLGRGLFELRIRGKKEVRIFYAFHSKSAVLLHGYFKKSQKIPKYEIDKAYAKLRELRS